MRLPGHQVRKSKTWPAELLIEPDTKIMQRDLRRQARLKSAEVMRPFAIEAESMPELLIHGLHDLAYSRQPAAEPLGPRHTAITLRWAENLGAIGPPPGLVVGVPLEALVDDIWPPGQGAHARQAWVGMAAESKERLRQGLIFGTGRSKTKAGDHSPGVDRQEHMEAFIPAQPVAPANVGQARQPAGSAALGIPGRDSRAVKGFIGATLGRQELHEGPEKGHQHLMMLPHLAVKLLPSGQLRKGRPEVALRRAVKAALTPKALPLPKDSQGHYLTPAESCQRPTMSLSGQGGLAKIIDHDVKRSQEGVHIDHSMCSLFCGR